VIAEGADGRTVAVQLHGFVDEEQLDRLRAAGASVITVAPYLWTTPAEPQRVSRMLDAIAARSLDAVTFTSAPAAEALLVAAQDRGVRAAVVARAAALPLSGLRWRRGRDAGRGGVRDRFDSRRGEGGGGDACIGPR